MARAAAQNPLDRAVAAVLADAELRAAVEAYVRAWAAWHDAGATGDARDLQEPAHRVAQRLADATAAHVGETG